MKSRYTQYQKRRFFETLKDLLEAEEAINFFRCLAPSDVNYGDFPFETETAVWVLHQLYFALCEKFREPDVLEQCAKARWNRPCHGETETHVIDMTLEIDHSGEIISDRIHIASLTYKDCYFTFENLFGGGEMSFAYRWPIFAPKFPHSNEQVIDYFAEKRVDASSFEGYDLSITPLDGILWWKFKDHLDTDVDQIKDKLRLAVASNDLMSANLEEAYGKSLNWYGKEFRPSYGDEDVQYIVARYNGLRSAMIDLLKTVDPDFDEAAFRSTSSEKAIEEDDVFALIYLFAHHANTIKSAYRDYLHRHLVC